MTEHSPPGAQSDTLDRVVIGKVNGVFGVRGQLKVFSYTDPRENIYRYDPWLIGSGDGWQTIKVVKGQQHGKGIIVSLEGCEDRDQAQALVGQQIAITRDQLPETEENEFYWSDLVGLAVVTSDGVELGRVDHLFETGSNDVLVVKGERQRLIPYIRDQVVENVDLEQGQMTVDWDPEF